jgi:hypothetical protein
MNNLTYEEAMVHCKTGAYITRPDWNGFHFIENGVYKIMLKEGIILENPVDIQGKGDNDWCVVDITLEAIQIMLNDEK